MSTDLPLSRCPASTYEVQTLRVPAISLFVLYGCLPLPWRSAAPRCNWALQPDRKRFWLRAVRGAIHITATTTEALRDRTSRGSHCRRAGNSYTGDAGDSYDRRFRIFWASGHHGGVSDDCTTAYCFGTRFSRKLEWLKDYGCQHERFARWLSHPHLWGNQVMVGGDY